MSNRARVAVVAVLIGVLAACAPSFPDGSTVTVSGSSPLPVLSWPEATADEDSTVASYGIEVDGVEVAQVDGGSTSCVLIGLAAKTTYSLGVTAYDSSGEWSGSLGGDRAGEARATGTFKTGNRGSGSKRDCVPTTDTDGDRLPDGVETGTGRYNSPGRTGTSPTMADTDGDGISDGDEVLGTTGGLNLFRLGARPVKQDLLFELDWFVDANDCASHSHRPSVGAITRATEAFSAAPVTNPDGTTGINVIADYGQGGAFTGGNEIADADGVIASGVSGSDYLGYKAANFSPSREGYFHYVLMPHRYEMTSGSSGQAEILGDDLIVSLQCYGSDVNVANTLVHEVGHNLGLRHGGDVNTNYKPNYNSVMNYRYQFPGVDTDCNVAGNGVLDFSNGSRAALNETALVEAVGVCGGVALDWNGNGLLDVSPVAADINTDTLQTVLTDWDDWSNLVLGAVDDWDGASADPHDHSQPEIVTEQPVPPHARTNR